MMGWPRLSLPKMTLPAFALPRLAPTKCGVALVIRPEEVQLVWTQGPKVAGHAHAAISDPQPESLARAIGEVVAAAKLKSLRLAVSIESPEILVRFFKMPFLPAEELDSAVQFEARKYIPFKMEALAWDYQVISPVARAARGAQSPEQLEVVFSAIPGEALNRFQQAMASAGIQPMVLEPSSQSLARLGPPVIKGRAAAPFECLVELHSARASLVIARAGTPHLTRAVHGPAGSAIGEEETTTLLQRLISELSVSMDFFKREYPSATFGSVRLVADDEALPRYRQALAGALSCPVESAASLLTEAERAAPLSFAVALGALRREASAGGTGTLNFLHHLPATVAPLLARASAAAAPQDFIALAKQPGTPVTAAATALALSCALWLFGNADIARKRQQLEAAQHARLNNASPLGSMAQDALQAVQDHAKEQLRLLQGMVDRRPRVAAKLDALARALPEGVWLTALTFDHKLEATGTRSGGQQVARLVVSGACYLGGNDRELKAFQQFETQVKNTPAFQNGLPPVRIGKVTGATVAGQNRQQSYAYKTFQLSCQSGGRL